MYFEFYTLLANRTLCSEKGKGPIGYPYGASLSTLSRLPKKLLSEFTAPFPKQLERIEDGEDSSIDLTDLSLGSNVNLPSSFRYEGGVIDRAQSQYNNNETSPSQKQYDAITICTEEETTKRTENDAPEDDNKGVETWWRRNGIAVGGDERRNAETID
ncbi:hypothetical protein Trydic_g17911 [Trypoxylus dichotomus]